MFATDEPSVWVCTDVDRSRWACASEATHTRENDTSGPIRPPQITTQATTRSRQASRRSGEDPARLGTPEVVERRAARCRQRTSYAQRQVAAEAEQPAGHARRRAGRGERRGGSATRRVEPGGVDALEAGEQRVDPARSDRAGSPSRRTRSSRRGARSRLSLRMSQCARPRGSGVEQAAHEVEAAVAPGRAPRPGTRSAGQVRDVRRPTAPSGRRPPRRRRSRPARTKRRAASVRRPARARAPSRSVAASRVAISGSSRRSACRPSTSSSRRATQAPSSYDARRSRPQRRRAPISPSASTSRRKRIGRVGVQLGADRLDERTRCRRR